MNPITSFPICSLQEEQAQSFPTEESVETDILVQIEQGDVQSAPVEISSVDIQVSEVRSVD